MVKVLKLNSAEIMLQIVLTAGFFNNVKRAFFMSNSLLYGDISLTIMHFHTNGKTKKIHEV